VSDYGREQHFQGVGAAGIAVAELEGMLLAAKLKQQDVLGTVALAVGDPPAVESGRNALEWTAALTDKLDEITRICEMIKAELNRYGGGF
jgi:hypothetical protein